nr:hypothetical protein CFP56_03205 [Quercus suber]
MKRRVIAVRAYSLVNAQLRCDGSSQEKGFGRVKVYSTVALTVSLLAARQRFTSGLSDGRFPCNDIVGMKFTYPGTLLIDSSTNRVAIRLKSHLDALHLIMRQLWDENVSMPSTGISSHHDNDTINEKQDQTLNIVNVGTLPERSLWYPQETNALLCFSDDDSAGQRQCLPLIYDKT